MNRPLSALFSNPDVIKKINTSTDSLLRTAETNSLSDCPVTKDDLYQSPHSEQIDQRILKREERNIGRTNQIKTSIRIFEKWTYRCLQKCSLARVFKRNYLSMKLLKPTGHVTHHQFNIQQLYALPTLYLCVLYLSENKQRLVPLTA